MGQSTMLMFGRWLVLTLVSTAQVTAYTLVAPKIYSQSLPTNSRSWSNVVPYPFRTYQPSLPLQYYNRYYGNPYFAAPNLQNADYYYNQDPYTASFDDADYYSNYLYYIPASRQLAYYEPPMVESVNDVQDYEDEPSSDKDDNVFKMQRDWWLKKNVMPDEDTDYDRFSQLDDFVERKSAKAAKKTKPKEVHRSQQKSRYAGIDGFGRNKDREQVYGSYRINPRRDEELPRVYAEPTNTQYNDPDVRDLKKLYEETGSHLDAEMEPAGEPVLSDWMRGHVKKSVDQAKYPHRHDEPPPQQWPSEQMYKSWLQLSEDEQPYSMYNEGGHVQIAENTVGGENKWSDYLPEETSVFDTLKKLLASDYGTEQNVKINKRIRETARSKIPSFQSAMSTTSTTPPSTSFTTAKPFPNFDSRQPTATPSKQIKNRKRSAISGKKPNSNSNYSDEEFLAQELSALRRGRS